MLKHCNPIKHGLTSSTLSKLGFQILNCVLGGKKKKDFQVRLASSLHSWEQDR